MATQRQAVFKMCMLLKVPISSMFCHVGISYYIQLAHLNLTTKNPHNCKKHTVNLPL